MRLYLLILLSLGAIQNFSMNKPFDLDCLDLPLDEQDKQENDEMRFILYSDGGAAAAMSDADYGQLFSSLSTAF